MSLDDPASDEQAHPHAIVDASAGGVQSVIHRKDAFQLLRGDADPEILDPDQDSPNFVYRRNHDLPFWGRVLQCVR